MNMPKSLFRVIKDKHHGLIICVTGISDHVLAYWKLLVIMMDIWR